MCWYTPTGLFCRRRQPHADRSHIVFYLFFQYCENIWVEPKATLEMLCCLVVADVDSQGWGTLAPYMFIELGAPYQHEFQQPLVVVLRFILLFPANCFKTILHSNFLHLQKVLIFLQVLAHSWLSFC